MRYDNGGSGNAIEDSGLTNRIIAIVVAVIVTAAVLIPVADGLADANGTGTGGGSGGSVGGVSDLIYTNASQYHYQDYDKAVADAMAVSYQVTETESSIYATFTVGNYTVTTPTYDLYWEWDSGSDEWPDDYQFILPVFEISGGVAIGGQTMPFNATTVFYLVGWYDGTIENDKLKYDFAWAYAQCFYNPADSTQFELLARTLTGFGDEFESINTMGDLIQTAMIWAFDTDDAEGVYASVRMLSSTGDYVLGKNPVVASTDGLLSFNTLRTYWWGNETSYTTPLCAYGATVSNEQVDFYNGSGHSYFNNPVSTLDMSTIDDAVRLDGISVLYVGTSSDQQAYLAYSDVYAIVPATVHYNLQSGDNSANASARLAYYDSVPTMDVALSYETDSIEISSMGESTTTYYVSSVTATYGGKTIVFDMQGVITEFKNRMESATSYEDVDEIMDWLYDVYAVFIYASANEAGGFGLPTSNDSEEDLEEGIAYMCPNNYHITPTGIDIEYSSSTEYAGAPGFLYLIDDNGTYGMFTASDIADGLYVTPSILTFDGPIIGSSEASFPLGISNLYMRSYSDSMYEVHTYLQDGYQITIEDGKLTAIGYEGGYRQTGVNPNGEVGYIPASLVVLPLTADNGGGSGGDGGNGGSSVTGTIIKVIPIFVFVAILLYSVQFFSPKPY